MYMLAYICYAAVVMQKLHACVPPCSSASRDVEGEGYIYVMQKLYAQKLHASMPPCSSASRDVEGEGYIYIMQKLHASMPPCSSASRELVPGNMSVARASAYNIYIV
jgi:hypothetical protein